MRRWFTFLGETSYGGGYSQIEVELLLLEEAVKRGPFQFYHLLSGQDLPIKTHEEILSFFDRHAGEEFVAFERDSFAYGDRVLYSHGLWNRFGKSKKDILMLKADRLACCLQRALGIRQNGGVEFQKGSNWFSIGDGFARYVVSQKDWVASVFGNSFCGDEVFLQTLLLKSPYFRRLHYKGYGNGARATSRLMDWDRGNPYTFQRDDYDSIRKSPCMFARKFDPNIDAEVIRLVAGSVRG